VNALGPIAVAIPIAAAAILIAVLDRLGRRVAETLSLAACVATLGCCLVLVVRAATVGPIVTWLGGWGPGNPVALGIAFEIDLASAAVGSLASAVVLAAVVFSRQYFERVGAIFYVMVLAMLGAMVAFAFTADAFDLFVFYEIFSVAAYALSAYRNTTKSAFTGALQFALTNTVAGLCILFAIILLEGRTGELNLATIGHALAGDPAPPMLLAVTLGAVAIGLFTRGAIAPVHFWIDEVHASAPTPLCIVLTGAMLPLALYGFERMYWEMFSQAVPPSPALAGLLAGFGIISAAVGSIMCLRETRLKRAIAFSSVAHGGVAVAAFAGFTAQAIGGAALYIVGYAFGGAALFAATSIVRSLIGRDVHVRDSIGVGRQLRLTRIVFALGVADVGGVFVAGRSAVVAGGLSPVLQSVVQSAEILVAAATGGAFVRAFWLIFVAHRPGAAIERTGSIPAFLLGPALGLALAPIAISLWPHASDVATTAAAALIDVRRYGDALRRSGGPPPTIDALAMPPAWAWLGPLGALGVGAATLTRARPMRALRIGLARFGPFRRLVRLHDGNAGEYVGWVVGSVAVAASICTLAAR